MVRAINLKVEIRVSLGETRSSLPSLTNQASSAIHDWR